MDHVLPVVDPVAGFTTFDEYIDRMFPSDTSGWQRLCVKCHTDKTQEENGTRKETKIKKKKVTKTKES
jgi:5-methylcytosine-specific restriction endonuclease McrA